MEKTWRWFGKSDPITLSMLKQIGVQGIVTALHQVKNGDIWTLDNITNLKNYIQNSGLHWSVVESLPVMEPIKFAGKERDQLIDNYIISLQNLGKAGITTVCYNFMPVIDWIRTDLYHKWDDGTQSLYFDRIHFAYFDIHILKRENAQNDYTQEEINKVNDFAKTITQDQQNQLIDTIIVKTQGFVNGNISEQDTSPVQKFRDLLSLYNGINRDTLRQNLKYFLNAIMPTCNQYNINMCIHPDDPPYQLLGLPRIVTCDDDINWLLNAVDNPHNGLTFCAGSLSAGLHNNVTELARKYASRTHFIHLRSTNAYNNGNFIEAPHTEGRANIPELVRIFEQHCPTKPMRVDHGRNMLGDEKLNYNPGYSFHGRMLALAQLDGMIAMTKTNTTI